MGCCSVRLFTHQTTPSYMPREPMSVCVVLGTVKMHNFCLHTQSYEIKWEYVRKKDEKIFVLRFLLVKFYSCSVLYNIIRSMALWHTGQNCVATLSRIRHTTAGRYIPLVI